jgi:adenine-specific DNA methylase
MVDVEYPGHLFTQQAVQTGWDFAEANPLSSSSGSFQLVVENTTRNVQSTVIASEGLADIHSWDATRRALPSESASVWFTDPPYYDAIPYSDLSDFFFVWLRRALGLACSPKSGPVVMKVLGPWIRTRTHHEADSSQLRADHPQAA